MKHFSLLNILHHSIFPFLLGLGMLFLISSCTLHRLDVQTQYLTPDYLASSHIGTPDPRLSQPLIGQRLLIQWSLSAQEMCEDDLFLYLKVRFRNHHEEEVSIPITSKRGTYLFHVNSELYCQTKGILTYLAEIRNSTCMLARWKHPLWVELIQLDFPERETSAQEMKQL